MPIVVGDTSPIRALAFLGLMDLLREVFAEILIPPAVDRELKRPASGVTAFDVDDYPFVRIRAPSDLERVEQFSLVLDLGESEALALALEVHAGVILIDERDGRAVALSHGLVPIGVLGILLRAKERDLIVAIRPLIDQLQEELNFFISARLRTEVLRLAGE